MSEKKTTYDKVKLFGKDIKINTLLLCGFLGFTVGGISNADAYFNRSDAVKQQDEKMRQIDPEHTNENATYMHFFNTVAAMCAYGLGRKKDEEDTRSFSQRFIANTRDGASL